MLRSARIDAPLAFRHIILCGLEREAIFKNDIDRHDFIDRLGNLLKELNKALAMLGL